jgi:RHS repeat-associated protein
LLLEPLEDRMMLASDLTAWAYDPLGNVVAVRDALGQETRFEYDGLARVTAVRGPAAQEFVNLTYDAGGNVTSMHDATGYTFYDYDAFNRLTSVVRSDDDQIGNADDRAIQYAYDLVGNLDTLTYPDGTLVDYDYDAVNRLVRVAQGSDITTYTYYPDGQLDTATLPNGITASYSYDVAGRLTDLVYENAGGHLVSSFHYTFDANSNRTSMEVRRPNLETPDLDDFNSGLYQYGYDARNQLTSAAYPDGSVATYTYDGAGNRLSLSTDPDGVGPQAAVVLNYHYDVENRLTHTSDAGGNVVTSYGYDARGNRITETTGGQTTTYEYDYRNLLIRVDDGTTVVEYDGNGDRVTRIENGVRADYVNDVNRAYTQVLAQMDDGGTVMERYLYGLGRVSGLLPGQAEPLYYLTDVLGSTTDLTDGSGMVVTSYRYDAFGTVRETEPSGGSGVIPNRFLFTGQHQDDGTALVYLRARWYAPLQGRFLSKDPAGFLDGTNTYTYVGNDPIDFTDPSGNFRRRQFLEGMGSIAGGAMSMAWGLKLAIIAPPTAFFTVPTLFATGTVTIAAGFGKTINAFEETEIDIADGTFEMLGMNSPTMREVGKAGDLAVDLMSGRPKGVLGIVSDSLNAWKATDAVFESTTKIHNATRAPRTTSGNLIQLPTNPLTAPGSTLRMSSLNPSLDFHPAARDLGSNQSYTKAALDRGGVLLTQPAEFLAEFSGITGALVDPVSGQVILLGEQVAGVPELKVDDFVAALRAVYGSTEAPGVSIDPPASGNSDDPQTVTIFAGLEDTHLGYVFFEADRVMKSLAAGRDNIEDEPVSSSVPGYKSMAQRWADSFDPGNPNQIRDAKWYFLIDQMSLVRSDQQDSFLFDTASLKLVALDPETGGPSPDPDAQAFASWFTDNYDAIAAEAYAYPSLDGMTHPFARLKQGAQSVAFAQFLRDHDIGVDFSWIDLYRLPFVDTPETTRTVVVQTPAAGGGFIEFTGGVEIAKANTYLVDANGVVELVAGNAAGTRGTELAQSWTLSDGTTRAVALSLDSAARDGNIVLAETDLVVPTVGAFPLAVQRFYNSFQAVDGPFGFGWEAAPRELQFSRPAYHNSTVELNGLREGEVRFVDRATGQALTFESSLQVTRHVNGPPDVTGLSDGLPTFTPTGLRDGSTLALGVDRATYTLTRPGGATQQFDSMGRLLREQDRNGNAVLYGYTGNRLTSIGDATGVVFTFAYDTDGHVTHMDATNGERVEYAYDADGNLISAMRVRGAVTTTYAYDDGHRITSSVGPDGLERIRAVSDVWNRSTEREDLRGNLAEFQYAADPAGGGRITTVEDVYSGLTSATARDSFNRPTASTDGLGRTVHYGYDPASANRNPTSIQLPDPGRAEIQFTYNAEGRIVSVYDPENDPDGNGYTQQFFYDGQQNLIRHIDAREIETAFVYDTNNNLTQVQRGGTVWQYTYYANGLLQSVSNPCSHATTYFYDSRGNLTKVRDAAGAETVYAYDALNRMHTMTAPLGRAVHLTYNDFDQVVRVDVPQGHMTYEYDAASKRLTRVGDFKGQDTVYAYDAQTGDLISETVDGTTVSYTYDRHGRLASLRDHEGTKTVFLYDDLGRPAVTMTSFDETVASLREAEVPWTIVHGTLVIAGQDVATQGDSILLDTGDDGVVTLTVNLKSYFFGATDFDAIYVDAGDGDDLVDLRSVPPGVNVTILGGAGSDVLLAGPGNDVLFGGDGADWIEGGGGNDWLFGGKDADALFGHISTSASILEDADATRNRLFGGDGDDLLYSRWQDQVVGGAGADSYFGIQADGSYHSWAADDVPLGLSGRLLIIGNDEPNHIVIKQYQDKLLVTLDNHTRVVAVETFHFVTGLFSKILVLSGGASDYLDASDSPVPIFFFGGPGGNTAFGSATSGILIGGSGADVLHGQGGDDRLYDGRGADQLHAGGGNNQIFSSDDGEVDTLNGERGASGRSTFVAAPNDGTVNTNQQDLVISGGQQQPDGLLIPRPTWFDFPVQQPTWIGGIGTTATTAARSASASQTTRPAQFVRALPSYGITEFSVDQDVAVKGESLFFTIRTNSTEQWGRLTLLADITGSGIHGFELGTFRGRTLDWSGQVSTRRLPLGVVSVIGMIEYYNGTRAYSNSLQIEIVDPPAEPELMPLQINVSPENVGTLLPHVNGDVDVLGIPLRGEAELHVWEISPRIAGNFRISIEGVPVVVAWYDTAGNRLMVPDDGGALTAALEADTTYYFALTGKEGATGTYDLRMTGRHQSWTDEINVPAAAFRGSVTRTLSQDERLNYLRVQAPSGATYLDVSLDVEPGLNAWIRVDDHYGTSIGQAELFRAGRDQSLDRMGVEGGRIYYVTVLGQLGTTGSYTVTADFGPDLPDFADSIYPPPAWGSYTPLFVQADGDVSVLGQEISAPGQLRYYRIAPNLAGEYVFRTVGSTNMQLAIYDPSGTELLDWDDDSAGGGNALLRYQVDLDGPRWIVARAKGSATGSFELHVIGPAQHPQTIGIAGLSYEGNTTAGVGYSQRPQTHFVVVAPESATTMDVTVTPFPTTYENRKVDIALNIEREDGTISAMVNNGGPLEAESLTNFSVVGGQTYWITVIGWAETIGDSAVHVDFNPNFTGSGEIPVNSSTNGSQRYPAITMNNSGRSVFAWIGDGQGSTYDTWDDDVFYQIFDPAGHAVGEERKANVDDGEVYQTEASVGIADDASFVIAWVAIPAVNTYVGSVYFRRFDAQGNPLDQEETDTGLSGNTASIAVSDHGEFMVVASDPHTSSDLISGRIFNASGIPITPVLEIDTTLDEKWDVDVVVDGNGNYLVTWTSKSDDGNSVHVYVLRLDGAGNILPSGRNDYVYGRVSGRWFDDTNQNGIQDPDESGLPNVTLFLDANGNGVRDGNEPQVTTNADGDYTFTNILAGFHRILPVGGGSGGPATVGDDFNRSDNTDLGPAWLELNGDFRIENGRVVAPQYDYPTLVYQEFSDDDQVVFLDLYNNSTRNGAAHVRFELARADDTHFISVGFHDDYWGDGAPKFNKMFFRYGTGGRAWPRMNLPNSSQNYFDITPFSSARIVASYDSAAGTIVVGIDTNFDGVYEQMYQAGGISSGNLGTGVAIGAARDVAFDNFAIHRDLAVVPDATVIPGEEFRVAIDQTAKQWPPRIAANSSGQFVVVWPALDTDGTGENIYAQVFDANANALTSWVPVNHYRTNSQYRPDVAMKDNGEFIVVWESVEQDGSGRGVYARQFDANGQPATLEDLRINDTTEGNQWFPVMATDGENRFGFAWQSYDLVFSDGIFGRFLDFPDVVPRALVTITDDCGDANDLQIDFGSVIQYQAPPAFAVTLRNSGTATLEGSVSLAGPHAAAFAIVGDTEFNLAPGQSRTVPITFETQTRGARRAQLVIADNAGDGPSIVELLGAVVPAPDAWEGNDTLASAADLGLVSQRSLTGLTMHRVDDMDFFAFQVDHPGLVSVTAAFPHNEGDLDFAVLNQEGKLMPSGAGASRTDNEFAVVPVNGNQPIYVHVYGTGPVANVYDLTITQYRLSVSVDRNSIVENEGAAVALGTVTRQTGDASTPLSVRLVSSDTTRLSVRDTVTIPAHSLSASFPIDAVDDRLLNGILEVTITAHADGHVADDVTIEVLDYEPPSTLAATLVSGTLTIADPDGVPNDMTIRLDGTDLVIEDASEQFAGAPEGGTLSNGSQTLTIPLASITGALIINLGGGDDLLTIDFTGGIPIPADGLSYDGGAGDDALALVGGAFHTQTFTYVNASDGSVALDLDGLGGAVSTIEYVNLEPITSSVASDVVELIYTGGDETIAVTDTGGGQTTVDSTLGEITTFNNPSQRLEIVATVGKDTVNVNSLASGYASLVIRGTDASDAVNFNGPLTFAAGHDLTVSEVGTVRLPNANSDIATSGSGSVTIEVLRNIELATGSSITAVDGDISLAAHQQATPLEDSFIGISLSGATLTTTGDGDILLQGRGGDDSSSNYGVSLQGGGVISSNGTGTITLNGTGGNGTFSNHGVFLFGAGTKVTSVSGAISITGKGDGSGTSNHGVYVFSGAVVESTGATSGATITLDGTGNRGRGVFLTGTNTVVTSVSGAIGITGKDGVDVTSGAVVASTGTTAGATITLDGTGTISTSGSTRGVFLDHPSTKITSVSGAISITGKGGGSGSGNYGIYVNGAVVESTGTTAGATITLAGDSGNSTGTQHNYGVNLQGSAKVSSVSGAIDIAGKGRDGTGSDNYGIYVGSGSVVESTGETAGAPITLNGTGGTGSSTNHGVFVSGVNTKVSSVSGAINITGNGGDGSGASNYGILVSGQAAVESTGATITLTGTGGNGTGLNFGVRLANANTKVSSASGAIEITGTGGDGSSSNNYGIDVSLGALVESTGLTSGATINLVGIGGNGSIHNYGVNLSDPNTTVTSVSGTIAVIGTGGSGATSFGLRLASSAAVTSTGSATIGFTSDSMEIGGTATIDAGTNTVTLRTRTIGTSINLGGADVLSGSPLTLGLIDAELDRITAGTLVVGSAASGEMTVSAAITRSAATDVHFLSGGAIVFDPGSLDAAGGNVVLVPAGGLRPLSSGVDVTADSVTLASGTQLSIDIAGTTADTQYSRLNVAGDVDLTGATLALGGSYSPQLGDTFTIVNNGGSKPVVGTFAGLPEGAAIPNFLGSPWAATISYAGGDGNDVVLVVTSELSIAPLSAEKLEGNSGSTPFTFTVTRVGNTGGTASVAYVVSGSGDDPADEADFTGGAFPSGTVNFLADEVEKTITINVAGDTLVESDETFTVTLSNPVGATIGTATAIGTILNDDASLSIAPLSAEKLEGNSGSTPFTFTVTRVGYTGGTASVAYAVTGSGDDPADEADFTGGAFPSGTVEFGAGEVTKTITVNVAGDMLVEPDETFTVALSNPVGATISTASAVGTILNDDASLSIAPLSAEKLEGNSGSTPFTFTVTRVGYTGGTASVAYAVTGSGDDPADEADFTGGAFPSGTVNFLAGEVEKTITVNVAGDMLVEPDETFTVTLSNPVGATISTASAVGTILNDDASLSIAPLSAERLEGNSGSTPFTFTVTRVGYTGGTASVAYVVSGSGDDPADEADFTGGAFPSGTVNFLAGEVEKTITINVAGDTLVESDETFTVTLSNPVGATISTASAVGTILNDDASLSIAPLSAGKLEGNSGSTPFTFTVTRVGYTGGTASVAYAVSGSGDDPANAADFTGGAFPSGTVNFLAGEVEKTITINVAGDMLVEPDETFTVTLSNPVGATISTATAVGTILNDDFAPTTLTVTSLDVTTSGFTVNFSQAFDVAQLNLYQGAGATLSDPDILVVGNTVGAVAGTVIVDPSNEQFTFVRTGSPLAPDTYTVTLRSAPDGFATAYGELLDGDSDDQPGGDYVGSFTVLASSANSVTVRLPDFMRGPGQDVHVPNGPLSGIPLRLSNADGVFAVDLACSPSICTLPIIRHCWTSPVPRWPAACPLARP